MVHRGLTLLVCVLAAASVQVQVQAQGRGAPAAAPPTPRAQAPMDLTGYWVAIISEDWRWRMITPSKGDYPSIPMTLAAQKVADAWDPAKDEAAGEQCKAYGAPGLMRGPTRLRLSWLDDTTLKLESDYGMQTRLFHFRTPAPTQGAKTWQGVSTAQWVLAGGGRGRGGPRFGSLKTVTTQRCTAAGSVRVAEEAAVVADAELMFGHAISARLRLNPEFFPDVLAETE